MKYWFSVCLGLISVTSLFAQGRASFGLDEVIFSNGVEEIFFETSMVDRSTIAGLLAIYDYREEEIEKIESEFYAQVEVFRNSKHSKKEEKYLKQVYDFVKNNFLRTYIPSASFADLVTLKRYNQITASAVFALTLDALGIRYHLVKSSIGTYLLVGTTRSTILIEPMDPVQGFSGVSNEFQENFLNQLVSRNLVDPTQKLVDGPGVFNVHYYTKEYIDINELAGLLYLDFGLTAFGQGDLLEAINLLKKSYLLYPSADCLELILTVSASHLVESEYSKEADIDILTFIASLQLPVAKRAGINGEISRLLYESLTNRYDTAYAKLARDKICSSARDREIREEMDFLYHYERGRLMHNKGQYAEAMSFCSRAFVIRPDNIDAEQLLISNTTNRLNVSKNDTKESLEIIENVFEKHPALLENRNLTGYRLFLYLRDMAECFDNKNEAGALRSKEKFEELMSQSAFGVTEYDIGTAYSKGASYYFRKGKYSSAKTIANEGLKLAPDSRELQMRKSMINASMY